MGDILCSAFTAPTLRCSNPSTDFYISIHNEPQSRCKKHYLSQYSGIKPYFQKVTLEEFITHEVINS